ncbi:MAG: hypothetical protein PHO80_03270, partial [Candidatus Gracilibacteria bacterium]|nr:hypothetical protein [Candidatus Gracilibacteria bacterium]
MIKNELNEVLKELYRKDVNPKIRQKMEILEMNDDFLKDMFVLRKKWANVVKEYNFYFIQGIDRVGANARIASYDKNGLFRWKYEFFNGYGGSLFL